jgi:glucose-6-phosphate 1-dehydrogenase
VDHVQINMDESEGIGTRAGYFEVELAWQIVEPVMRHWSADKGQLHRYASGSWGPAESARLLEQTHHAWRNDP